MRDFTILLLPGAHATGVAVSLDILRTASMLAPRLHLPAPRWRVLSPAVSPLALTGGMYVEAESLPRRYRKDSALWVIPGLSLDSPDAIATGLRSTNAARAIKAVASHAAAGGRVAASCSAVFLLQAAGLLAERKVTTTWWLASELRRGCRPDGVCRWSGNDRRGRLCPNRLDAAPFAFSIWRCARRCRRPRPANRRPASTSAFRDTESAVERQRTGCALVDET
jgi:hypothetical protein